MKEQIIYSRFEYPIGNIDSSMLFAEYANMSGVNEEGVTVSGLNVTIRTEAGRDGPRAAIILTYDRESDTYMKLKLCNRKDVTYKKIN